MIERLFPDKEVDKVESIGLKDLMDQGIKGVIIDIDNTISEWKLDPTENVAAWLEMLKSNGIKICLVSNNRRIRAEKLSRKLEVHAIYSAFKPRRKAFISAITLMGIKASETAVVGDQIFTDIYGGNRLNMFTIYVRPIADRDHWFVKIKRPFEKYVLAKFRVRDFEQKERRLMWKVSSGERKLKKH